MPQHASGEAKVFWFFFSKKNILSACLVCLCHAAHAAAPLSQIATSYDSSKCLDIFQGSRAPDYGVDLFSCITGDPHETFAFQKLPDGLYKIIPQNGGNLCLDAGGISNSQVVQKLCSESSGQSWKLQKNADSTFSILTADGTRRIEVEGSHATANRSRVVLKPAADTPDGRYYVSGLLDQGQPFRPQSVVDGDRSIGPVYLLDPSLMPRAGVPRGRLIDFTMDSAGSLYFPGDSRVTGAFTRHVWVYVPKQYVKGQKAPFMVAQDAGYRQTLPAFLDNAIADRKLPVMVIVFAGNGGGAHGRGVANDQGTERNLEYDTVSTRYGDWVQNELLPRVAAETLRQMPDQAVSFTSDPEGRGAIGCSSGAAASFTMAWFRPDLFRRVISFSGSYTNLEYPADPRYPRGAWSYSESLVRETPKKPIRVWLEVGTQDLDWGHWGPFLDWQTANRDLAAALMRKGYHVHFDLAQQARHCDPRVFNETLGEAMEWVWRDYRGSMPR